LFCILLFSFEIQKRFLHVFLPFLPAALSALFFWQQLILIILKKEAVVKNSLFFCPVFTEFLQFIRPSAD